MLQVEKCGNGVVDPPVEECDDGNTMRGDGCGMTCKIEVLAALLQARPSLHGLVACMTCMRAASTQGLW